MKFFRQLTLTAKLLLVYMTILMVFSIAFYSLDLLLSRRFAYRLAVNEGFKNVRSLLEVLEKEGDELRKAAIDWGKWDDTYNFMQNKNEEYIKSNFSGGTLKDLRLNLFLFFDSQGRFFWGKGYDEAKDIEYVIKDLTVGIDKRLLKTVLVKRSPLSGWYRLFSKCYLFAACPILTSEGQGPPRGVLFIARKFDISDLNNKFPDARFQLVKRIPEDAKLLRKLTIPSLGGVVLNDCLQDSKVIFYLIFKDFKQRPVLTLEVRFNSFVLHASHKFFEYSLIFLFLGLAAIVAVLYIHAKKTVIAKVKQLSDAVRKINTYSLPATVHLPKFGEEELAILSQAFEDLIKTILEERSLLQSILDHVMAGIAIYNENGYLLVNRYFLEILKYTPEEIYQLDVWDIFHPQDREQARENLFKGLGSEKRCILQYETRLVPKKGGLIYALVSSINIDYYGQKARLGIFTDITLIKKAQQHIEHLAYRDTLTGLYNKNYLIQNMPHIAQKAREEGYNIALILFDIKNFSRFNISLGYPFGDQVLQTLGVKLQKLLREGDWAFRLGVDIFGAVISGPMGANTFLGVVERLKTNLESKFIVGNREIQLQLCLGLAIYPEHTKDPCQLLDHAGTALCFAKKYLHLPYVVYKKEIEERIKNRIVLEERLRKAIENKEFIVHYQPIYEIKTGRFSHFEALIRLPNDEGPGFIPPAEFIPIAEETGLITHITRLMFKMVCDQIRQWKLQGKTVKVAVNVSSIDIKQVDFVNFITTQILVSQIAPSQICIEITERTLMENTDYYLKLLKKLREFGITIAVDDFGTGYSSLSYLSYLPLDTLKIDMSFVQKIGQSRDDEIIVETIINLAHSLRLKSLAEGIETAEQLAFLKDRGCDYAQGYYLGKPCSAEEATKKYL